MEYLILNSIFFIIGYFSLNLWVKKRKIDKPFYYSIIIIGAMLTILTILDILRIFPINIFVGFFINSLVGAFLINKLFKQDFIKSLRFSSWYLFWITIGWYLILMSLSVVLAGIFIVF